MRGNHVGAVLRSEWIKARSTVGSAVTLPLAVAGTCGLALASGLSIGHALDTDPSLVIPGFNPIEAGLDPLLYGNMAFVVFAVLVFSSEYTTGMIRSSLAAVPNRGLFYLAKLAVVAAVALVVGGCTVIGSFLITESGFGSHGASLFAAGAPGAVLGAVAYVVLINCLSAAVAAMLRSTAWALGLLVPFFFAASPALAVISGTRPAARFLPDQAGMRAMRVTTEAGALTPGQGLLVLLLWTAALSAAGYWLTCRRDA
jgi:ABC-2 type transport system permease protein